MDEKDGLEFLNSVLDLLKETEIVDPKDDTKVVDFKQPLELKSILNLSLDDAVEGSDNDELENSCRKILNYSFRMNSRNHHFMIGGPDYYGVAGGWMVDAINAIMLIYELGGALVLVEEAVLKKVVKLFGYPEDSDGVFNPGGSLSIMNGIMCARYQAFPEVKEKGMQALPPLALFSSEDSHYAATKAANIFGLGSDSLIRVQTDSECCMIPEKLEEAIEGSIEEGRIPFCVIATAGTTVFGAVDPLIEIADICQKYNIWMHVDACWGGSLMLSNKYKQALYGIEKSNSLSWNPHKLLGAPLPCSIFLTRHNGIMLKCNSAEADYLYSKKKFYDVSYDKGDASLLCSRRDDSLKLWIMWKAYGDRGFEKLVNNAMHISEYFYKQLLNNEGFEILNKKKYYTSVCFYYVPKSMRNQTRTEEWWIKLGQVSQKVREKFIKEGNLYIASDPLMQKKLKDFFRVTFTCRPFVVTEKADYVIEKIKEYAENLII